MIRYIKNDTECRSQPDADNGYEIEIVDAADYRALVDEIEQLKKEKHTQKMDCVLQELRRIKTAGPIPACFLFRDEEKATKYIDLTRDSLESLLIWLKEELDDPTNAILHLSGKA